MTSSLEADGFHLTGFNEARPFSSFLPGIAGEYGKPMWVFYTNRGQCIASFGVRDRNGAMLEFQPANKAYALTPLLGFRSFFRIAGDTGATLHEPFLAGPTAGITQRLCVRAEDIEIEELHPGLGLRMRVVYFTVPGENLPVLARQVTLENTGREALLASAPTASGFVCSARPGSSMPTQSGAPATTPARSPRCRSSCNTPMARCTRMRVAGSLVIGRWTCETAGCSAW